MIGRDRLVEYVWLAVGLFAAIGISPTLDERLGGWKVFIEIVVGVATVFVVNVLASLIFLRVRVRVVWLNNTSGQPLFQSPVFISGGSPPGGQYELAVEAYPRSVVGRIALARARKKPLILLIAVSSEHVRLLRGSSNMLSIQEKIALPLTGAAAHMADWGRGKLEVEPLGNLIEQRMTVTHAIRRRDVVNRRYWWQRFLKIDTVVTHLRIESPRA